MWSFDRVVAGSCYADNNVQPVLHRYNDAKYIWGDEVARAWLQGLVSAHANVILAVASNDESGEV